MPSKVALASARMEAIVQETADEIADTARVLSVSDRVSDSINVRKKGRFARIVGAGDRGPGSKAFFAHIIEFGSVQTGARPFMTPAVEDAGPEFEAKVRGVY
jgi:HK97 gp10 family phage protein